jgi:hypothetical protein
MKRQGILLREVRHRVVRVSQTRARRLARKVCTRGESVCRRNIDTHCDANRALSLIAAAYRTIQTESHQMG